ncbi:MULTISPECIES: flagellar biosynthetic protein FliO [unclassified Beijerinckia]|uniref:flagellar biosynthetic protein FliO n=1 Tax=unclassified Beijerinckia TaxID=2638183 RepID=UPI00089ABF06|nr:MULTISPECIES: flagellar biosynthetic protein FliO [unclassified Beijerinckia]MDH7798584.1 flagellar protein FliO/FliZ [Beijerinckia sp. GAS462]SED25734.1 Flagellar biosynthesis protein, FliO [Beijerinckia sp. 28-YEA-48]
MQYLTTILGDGKPLLQIVLGLAAALLVLLIAVALYRAIIGRRIRGAAGGRARQPRLGVVDAYDLDRQRQLVLIRRDNVEHLVMIGGPNDILIESTISRVPVSVDLRQPKDFAAADATVEPPAMAMTPPVIAVAPAAPAPAAPMPVAPAPVPVAPIPVAPIPVAPAPRPIPPQPPATAPAPAAPVVTPQVAVPKASPAPAVAPPPAARPAGPFVPPPPPQPRPLTPRPLTPSVSRAGPTLPPRVDPAAPKPASTPPVPPPSPAALAPIKVEPKIELPPAPPPQPEPKPEVKPVQAAPKELDPLDALEEEMAKLLGRPTDKS